jgi:hypothetical protein
MAVFWRFESCQKLHQCRLARAVGANQTNPLSGANFKRKAGEDRVTGILAAKTTCGNQDHDAVLIRGSEASRKQIV